MPQARPPPTTPLLGPPSSATPQPPALTRAAAVTPSQCPIPLRALSRRRLALPPLADSPRPRPLPVALAAGAHQKAFSPASPRHPRPIRTIRSPFQLSQAPAGGRRCAGPAAIQRAFLRPSLALATGPGMFVVAGSGPNLRSSCFPHPDLSLPWTEKRKLGGSRLVARSRFLGHLSIFFKVLFYNQLKLQLLQGAESAAGVMQEKDNIDPKYQIEIKALLHCHEYEIHLFFFLI
ncbi:hypothetical protein EJB05_57352, partial [Eragrostis curvula]